jgi:hypothetical protein
VITITKRIVAPPMNFQTSFGIIRMISAITITTAMIAHTGAVERQMTSRAQRRRKIKNIA